MRAVCLPRVAFGKPRPNRLLPALILLVKGGHSAVGAIGSGFSVRLLCQQFVIAGFFKIDDDFFDLVAHYLWLRQRKA